MSRPWFQKDHLLMPGETESREAEGGGENGEIDSEGWVSDIGKQSLGYFKVVMCHAVHEPVHT